jgi:hypothetical protein
MLEWNADPAKAGMTELVELAGGQLFVPSFGMAPSAATTIGK